MMHHGIRLAILGSLFLALLVPGRAVLGEMIAYQQTDLVTNSTDPDLINPWGISSGATSPFWVSDNGTGKATLYDGAGTKLGLIVNMPNSDPITGQVFNGTSNFNGNTFLFASENGTIDGWKGGTNAAQVFAVADAVYKGLGISSAKDLLYAANFRAGTIDVFDSAHTAPIGSFSDPTAPAGYAPFNIQNLGGKFYVTFALQDAAKHDDVAGVGHGLIDVFNPVTNTFTRLVTGSAAGGTVDALNSPWGLALAPSSFGPLGGSLLVGNFGNGWINGFDPNTGALVGSIRDANGDPIVNPGLWGLKFGNNNATFDPNALYITAGGAAEDQGLFARINAVPEPSSGALGLIAVGLLAGWQIKRLAKTSS
ncbi:MAG: TIGR03118 family protein [Planctomycetaceae bacterium]